jgi:hypothetical protein
MPAYGVGLVSFSFDFERTVDAFGYALDFGALFPDVRDCGIHWLSGASPLEVSEFAEDDGGIVFVKEIVNS